MGVSGFVVRSIASSGFGWATVIEMRFGGLDAVGVAHRAICKPASARSAIGALPVSPLGSLSLGNASGVSDEMGAATCEGSCEGGTVGGDAEEATLMEHGVGATTEGQRCGESGSCMSW